MVTKCFFSGVFIVLTFFSSCNKGDVIDNKNVEDNGTDTESIKLTSGNEIDMGLSVNWSSHNVGGEKPEDFGDYFFYGDPYGDRDSQTEGMANIDQFKGVISGTKYDAAYVKWGSGWRIPTMQEQDELVKNCSAELVIYKGVKGVLLTAPNGNNIFLPAAGEIEVFSYGIYHKKNRGGYWNSDNRGWYRMTFDVDTDKLYLMPGNAVNYLIRCSIRPVKDK